jgi:hypothetical protein
MTCPYFKEVTMVFCDAAPLKKMVPADRVVQSGHCSCGEYEQCAVFLEAMTRLKKALGCQGCPSASKKEGAP